MGHYWLYNTKAIMKSMGIIDSRRMTVGIALLTVINVMNMGLVISMAVIFPLETDSMDCNACEGYKGKMTIKTVISLIIIIV